VRFDLSGCGAGLDESARSLLELGPLVASLGYDGLRINEEHFGQGRRVCFSPILPATALAMRTRRIGTGFQENAARTLELFASKVTPLLRRISDPAGGDPAKDTQHAAPTARAERRG
jgi:hypothetical protein